jgi:IstB-like ATP binding protein
MERANGSKLTRTVVVRPTHVGRSARHGGPFLRKSGYLTYGTDAANMLFHVVNERHHRHRPMIFTTNKSLKAWGRVLHDEDLAQAILDRVLERGRLLRLDGPSVRTLHGNLDEAMKEDSDQEADLVRISGKRWSEFPKPTDMA